MEQIKLFFSWLAKIPWREIFVRLPLPTLALAASYGVYQFSLFFVPEWVSVVTAASFELTYIGLSVTNDISKELKEKATRLAQGAVAVSVLYNSISAFMERNPHPERLDNWGLGTEVALAILHGAPLAIVAYLLSTLLLHTESKSAKVKGEVATFQPLVETLQAQIASLKGAVESFQFKAESLQGQLATLQGELATLKDDHETSLAANRALVSKIETLETQAVKVETFQPATLQADVNLSDLLEETETRAPIPFKRPATLQVAPLPKGAETLQAERLKVESPETLQAETPATLQGLSTPERRAKLKAILQVDSNLSNTALAKMFGVSHTTIAGDKKYFEQVERVS